MAQARPPRLPTNLRRVLSASPVPWCIVNGKRHYKLKIGGRLVAILPKSGRLDDFHGRADKNTVANVRRAIKEQTR